MICLLSIRMTKSLCFKIKFPDFIYLLKKLIQDKYDNFSNFLLNLLEILRKFKNQNKGYPIVYFDFFFQYNPIFSQSQI